MLQDHLQFNFCLLVVAGLCLPRGTFKLKWTQVYCFYMVLCEILSVISLFTIGANLIAPDVSLAKRCYSGFTSLATLQAIAKSAACYIYKDRLGDYFKLWDDLIESDADEELKDGLLKNAKAIKKLSICLFVFFVGPMIPWGSLPLFIKVLSYIVPSLENSYQFIAVPAQFPFDPLVSPVFEFITIFQGAGATIVNAKIIAYNCLVYALISCQIVQYKYLKKQFQNVLKAVGAEQKCKNTLKRIQEIELRKWIDRHCHLINLCHTLNQLYSPVLLVQFLVYILVLCSNAFVVIAGNVTKLEILFSLCYVITTLIQLCILCWLGEEISKLSINVTDNGFWEEWYTCTEDVQKNLTIVFERTKVPVQIKALGTFHLSFETFKSIVGTAYSYFMVLNQIRTKNG